MSKYITIVFLILSLLSITFAKRIENKVGTTGFQFLKLGVGARGNSLAGANVSVPSGPFSMYWNPAGICSKNKREVSVFNNNWIATINHSFIGVVIPVSENDYVGTSVIFVSMDDMEETTITQPQGTGRYFSAADYAITMTYGRRVTDRFNTAISVKYLNERIWDLVADGWALDVGFVYYYRKFHLGMSFSNFGMSQEISGSHLQFDYQIYPEDDVDEVYLGFIPKKIALPMSFRFGAAYDVMKIKYHTIAMMAGIYYSNDIGESENIGVEYSFMDNYIIRGGYQFNHEGFNWSAGAGIRFFIMSTPIEFDYTVVNLQDFGLRKQINISLLF